MRTAAALALLLALPASRARGYELPPSSGTHRVAFEADKAYFSESSGVITLDGNITLREYGPDDILLNTVRAMRLEILAASRTVVSPADFLLTDRYNNISYGRSGELDYANNRGVLRDGRFIYKKFIFKGRRVQFDGDHYVYKRASLTTCDYDPPHYRVRSSRIDLIPEKRFVAYNNFFFIGRIPVFYFPVIYRPLGGGTPFISSFYPGYDDRNGFYVKSNYVYRFAPGIKGKLFLDYFSRRGLGTGGEFDYHRPEKAMVNLSAYRIREAGDAYDRWGVNGGHWALFNRFSESDSVHYYAQSYFRLLSDPSFNNDFFRSNPFAVSPDKQAGAAVTRKSSNGVLRLSAFGRDERDPAEPESFRRAQEASPRLDFQGVPLKFGKVPLLNTFSGYAESAKDSALTPYQRRLGGNWTVTNTVAVARNISLTPSAFYSHAVYYSSGTSGSNVWVGRYGGALNLRYDRLWGSFDLNYSYARRTEPNRLEPDTAAPDRGLEAKSLSPALFVRPNYRTYLRLKTAYDLRDLQGVSFSRRFAPITAEYNYSPRPGLDLSVQDSFTLAEGNSSFVAQLSAGNEINYVNFGAANYSSAPRDHSFSAGFGWKPARAGTWRMEAVLRLLARARGGKLVDSASFYERTLVLHKDFHDFRTRWEMRVRPGVREFFVTGNLHFGPERGDAAEEASRQFWHPWRRAGEDRD